MLVRLVRLADAGERCGAPLMALRGAGVALAAFDSAQRQRLCGRRARGGGVCVPARSRRERERL